MRKGNISRQFCLKQGALIGGKAKETKQRSGSAQRHGPKIIVVLKRLLAMAPSVKGVSQLFSQLAHSFVYIIQTGIQALGRILNQFQSCGML